MVVVRRAGWLLVALALLPVAHAADGPVLHEYIEANPEEDLAVGATTPDGRMPAAVRTRSGVVGAPGFDDVGGPEQLAYGGDATPDSVDATFRIDRDTTQPSSVSYEDPFTPAVTPFKRLYAFDAVDQELELVVRDKKMQPVGVGGVRRPGDDHFYGDLFVDIAAGVPVRIPSVAAGTRVLALRVEPPANVELVRDSAENMFVIGGERRRVRLILELVAPRAAFGSAFPDVSYADLAPLVPSLPPSLRPALDEVLSHLGVSRALRPRDALAALVGHFRAFAPSADLPAARGGPELFRELVLSQKGVCRHRAYGFVLVAIGLGIPARFVHNEAHAWVEVGDGKLFRRIDLGGAAGRFDIAADRGAPPHAVPPDPYAWPEGAGSALSTLSGSVSGGGQPSPGASGVAPASSSVPPAAASSSAAAASAPSVSEPPPDDLEQLSPAQVALDLGSRDVRRGVPLEVKGVVVEATGVPCPNARVDVALFGPGGEKLIGSVPTDEQGRYSSQLTIPFDIDVGEYTVRASTPGAGECGPSR